MRHLNLYLKKDSTGMPARSVKVHNVGVAIILSFAHGSPDTALRHVFSSIKKSNAQPQSVAAILS